MIDSVIFMYISMVISNENILIYTYCLLMLTGNRSRIHRYRTNSKACTVLVKLCEYTNWCYDLTSTSEFLILISILCVSLYHVFIKDTIFNLCILYKLSVLYILMYNADLYVQILIFTCSYLHLIMVCF